MRQNRDGPHLRAAVMCLQKSLNPSPKTRRGILPLTIGLLALGIAVFGWGLHYNVSLYRSEHIVSHHWQPASLLAEEERPLALHSGFHYEPEFITAVSLSTLSLLLLAVDLLFRGKLRMRYARLQRNRSWRLYVKASFSPFFFRPPPSVLSL